MKKAEFIKRFVENRRANHSRLIKAGSMRLSESIMSLAEAPRDAANFWRRHAATLKGQTAEKFFEISSLEEVQPAANPVPATFDLGSIVLHGEETPLASAIVPDLWHVYTFLKANHPELIMSYLGKDISAADAVKLCWHLAHSLKNALIEARQTPPTTAAAIMALLEALKREYGSDFSFQVAGNGKTLARHNINGIILPGGAK